jgi:hypothetical protein
VLHLQGATSDHCLWHSWWRQKIAGCCGCSVSLLVRCHFRNETASRGFSLHSSPLSCADDCTPRLLLTALRSAGTVVPLWAFSVEIATSLPLLAVVPQVTKILRKDSLDPVGYYCDDNVSELSEYRNVLCVWVCFSHS